MKKIQMKLLSSMACLALVMTAISTYGYCFYLMNQEEVPAQAKKLLKDHE